MAKIGSLKLSSKNEKPNISAANLFTDREDPQEAFERKLRVINENRKDAFGVLCYYGVGGVGKTTFKNRLWHILNGELASERKIYKDMDAYQAEYDFNNCGDYCDKRILMTSLRTQLVNADPKVFRFCLFDAALVLFAKKSGIKCIEDKSYSGIIGQNPWLSSFISFTGLVPGAGTITGFIQAADVFFGAVIDRHRKKEIEKEYEDEIERMAHFTQQELLDHLHEYFYRDMYINMSYRAKKPLVIFLDTYEKYIDTFKSDTVSMIDDYWLRHGPNSIIQNIPGILWVVMGREKLAWNDDDPFWEEVVAKQLAEMTEEEKEELACETLEQHLLGDLSREDALLFFRKAGMYDEELAGQIYDNLTNGTPLFLDMCVRQYNLIKEKKTPEISDFGNNLDELVNRYLFTMPPHYKEMTRVFALLGEWDDEMVSKIIEESEEIHEFTQERYLDFIKHSFVIRKADGSYYMHEAVRRAGVANAGENLTYEIGLLKLIWYDTLTDDIGRSDWEEIASKYIASVFFPGEVYKQAVMVMDKAIEILMKCEVLKGNIKQCVYWAERLCEAANNYFPNTDLSLITKSYLAHYLSKCGYIGKAYEILLEEKDRLSEENLKNLPNDTMFINAIGNLGGVAMEFNEYELAERVIRTYCDKMSVIYGEDCSECIEGTMNLAELYHRMDEHDKALEYGLKAYNSIKKYASANKASEQAAKYLMVSCHENIGKYYCNCGEYENAIDYLSKARDMYKELYGTDNVNYIRVLSLIGNYYSAIKDYVNAADCYEKAGNLALEVLGEESEMNLMIKEKLAILFQKVGAYEEAIKLNDDIYKTSVKLYGDSNIVTVKTLINLASCYAKGGNYEKAIELNEQVLETCQDERCLSLVKSNMEFCKRKLEEQSR